MSDVSITSGSELEAWLYGKKNWCARIIALRTAMRIAPLASNQGERFVHRPSTEVSKAIFRTLLAGFGVEKFEAIGHEYFARRMAIESGQYLDRKVAVELSEAAIDRNVELEAASESYSDSGRELSRSHFRNCRLAAEACAMAMTCFDEAERAAIGCVKSVEVAAAAAVGLEQHVWQAVSEDCAATSKVRSRLEFLVMPLWLGDRGAFEDVYRRVSGWYSDHAMHGGLLSRWHSSRMLGDSLGFPEIDRKQEFEFFRRVEGTDDEWWDRGASTVYPEVAAWVKELVPNKELLVPRKTLAPSETTQNPLVLNFSMDEDCRSVIDPEVAPNGLQDDADSRDNHSEIRRLIEKALSSTVDSPTQQTSIAEPTQLLSEATGRSVTEVSPRLFVLRAREIIRLVEELEGDISLGVPLSEEQRKAFLPLVEALKLLATFDPKLAQLWSGKVGGEGAPLTREQLDAVCEALRDEGQTDPSAGEALGTAAGQVKDNADENDPARRTATEMVRNVFRSIWKGVKRIDGATKTGEKYIKLLDRAGRLWSKLKDYLPDDELITRILELLGKGGGTP